MAVGFGSVDNFQETIQATVDNAVDFARSQIKAGASRSNCLSCGRPIPKARRKAVPGCTHCVQCQSGADRNISSGYNRRGSKDSQLR